MLKYPDAQVISLGIGDTTEPIPEVITSGMAKVFVNFHSLKFLSLQGFCPKSFTTTTFNDVLLLLLLKSSLLDFQIKCFSFL